MANRDRLLNLLYERAYREGEFTLASGQTSNHYFDGRMVAMAPEGSYLIGEVVYDQIQQWNPDAIGGLAVGAVSMVTSIVNAAYHRGNSNLEGFFVRATMKEHGTGKLVEGKLEPGSRVVIMDDVVTSGKSMLKAIEAAEGVGCEVVGVTAVVDRLSGATELFAERNLPYLPVFTSDDVAGCGKK